VATESPDAFVVELKHWRDVRSLSQKALAERMSYNASYVSKVEGGKTRPSIQFVEAADECLQAAGALLRVYKDTLTDGGGGERERPPVVPVWDEPPAELVVEHDDATLYYDGAFYRPTQRRRIRNAGTAPVTRYLIRISVDRFPGNPERSNQLYREDPLTWDELQLTATVNGEPMRWEVLHDRDAVKEVWLQFENDHGRFPLYPGDSAELHYSYSVADHKWGDWFQRAVRLPTDRLSVSLVFPADLGPNVWGMQTTMTADAIPFQTPISRSQDGDNLVFTWSTEHPPMNGRYRLEWRFKNRPNPTPGDDRSPSATMAALGIVQEGDPILSQPTRTFDLPDEAEDARRVIAQLVSTAERGAEVHNFGKGMGLAAPQFVIDRAAAIVRPPGSDEIVTLINPRLIDESKETDEKYEGCLSFFDVRGMVPRPLSIHVEHQEIDGTTCITAFDKGMARLIAHELDHLNGLIYKERMRKGVEPISVVEYRGTGSSWRY
jgi:peptide deformylase